MYINVYNNILYIYAQYTCWMILYWHIGAGWPSKRPDIIAAALPNHAAGERCDLPWSERQLPALSASVPDQSHRQHLAHPGCRLDRWGLVQRDWPAFCMVLLWGKWWSTTLLFYRYPVNPSNGRLRNALSRFQQKRTAPILEVLMHCKWNWTFILWGFDSSWNLAHPWWIFLQSSTNSRIF